MFGWLSNQVKIGSYSFYLWSHFVTFLFTPPQKGHMARYDGEAEEWGERSATERLS